MESYRNLLPSFLGLRNPTLPLRGGPGGGECSRPGSPSAVRMALRGLGRAARSRSYEVGTTEVLGPS